MNRRFILYIFVLIEGVWGIKTQASDYASGRRFRHLTIESGLTNSNVYCFTQDQEGFIWIGTDDGLFRYDGFRFDVFRSIPGDTTSLNSNVIFNLYTDTKGNIWVGTYMGILRYDISQNRFYDLNISEKFSPGLATTNTCIYQIEDNEILAGVSQLNLVSINTTNYSVSAVDSKKRFGFEIDNDVQQILKDSDNNLWIQVLNKGLYKYNSKTGTYDFINLELINDMPESNVALQIFESSDENIWIPTRGGGLFVFNKDFKLLHNYRYNANNPYSLGSNEVYNVWESQKGEIYISTNGNGLNYFDPRTDKFYYIKHNADNKFSLLNNNTRYLFEDKQKNLWISSWQAGIDILINNIYQFFHNPLEPDNKNIYQSNTALSFYLEDENTLWVGTDGGGLKKIDRKTNQMRTYLPQTNNEIKISDRVIMTIYSDFNQNLWFGTYLGGITRYNPKTGKVTTYKNDPENEYSLGSNFVSDILEDSKGNLWIATNGGGLNLFDRSTGRFQRFLGNPDNRESDLGNSYLNVLCEDHNGDLWIGSFWGLYRLNIRNFNFTGYHHDKTDSTSLSHNSIFTIYQDKKNRLWIGTKMGVNEYDYTTDAFFRISGHDGISNEMINSILGDENDNLWIASNSGIIKFSPDSNYSIRFSEADGLQGNEFYRNSCHRGFNGELFFGGYNGFTSFFPDSIKHSEFIPNIIITKLEIFDQEITIGTMPDGRKILDKNISETDEITLKYSDKSLTFSFAAIDFIEGAKITYAYKLEGFNNDWTYADINHPFATYTNLNPGTYVLKVKAAKRNMLDEIQPGKSLIIYVRPPFYRTIVAYFLYLIFTLIVILYFWQLSLQRVKEKNQLKFEKLQREKEHELSQAKLRFFTNISHEFRTPLTLIIGPLEQLIQKGKNLQPYRKQLDIMLKNSRRMLRLINQLLDFRKFEGGKMKLRVEYSDIVQFIKDIVFSFEEYAIEKRIDYQFVSEFNNKKIWFDPDKIDKIMFNLLSNSFKFTPLNGLIKIQLKTRILDTDNDKTEYIEISVTDTGKGIPENELDLVFDRFYQSDNQSIIQKGSGLGLSLTKSFVEIHKGKINVRSRVNQGTTFEILLPCGDRHFTDDEKREPDTPGINKYIHLSPEAFRTETSTAENEKMRINTSAYTILVVEDNFDLKNYLETEISKLYNFLGASNGQEAYEMAIELMPDVIISDIMMPEMDGLELCEKLKSNIITSHIPIILLTAKTSVENQIEGMEAGADAYIPKPFRIDQVLANIDSILKNRQRLRQKLISGNALIRKPIRNTGDDKFIQKASDTVNKYLSEINFGVEEMSRELGLSRGHLHRKLKAITEFGPSEFIRNIRLQKAAELLLEKEYTISEICYKVGFNSPAYFSSCFKNYYKMTPTEYLEKNL